MDLPGSEEVSEAFRIQLVKQGVLPPQEGDPQPPPPQPDPLKMAQAQKAQADATLSHANAVKTQVQTQLLPAQLAAEMHRTAVDAAANHVNTVEQYHKMIHPPMPTEAGVAAADSMPPQGGFFMPNGQA
jgi:hypothetical protein